MAIQLYIKTELPFVEKRINALGSKEFIFVGIKVHSDSELNEIRKEFKVISDNVQLIRWQGQIEKLKTNLDISDEEVSYEVQRLESLIEENLEKQRKSLHDFYVSQVIYIKNAKLSLNEEGKVSDLVINDTREAKPIESLWETPEECLCALLDMYLDSPSFRDSLQSEIIKTVFNTNVKDEKLKN